MNHALRISEAEMIEQRRAAARNNRSIAGQAEYWMRLGRAVERDPRMTMSRIEAALRDLEPVDPGSLEDEELDELLMKLGDGCLTPQGEEIYRAIRESGPGVGLDEDGSLVYGGAEITRPTTPKTRLPRR